MSKKQISTYKFVPGVVTPDTNLFPNAWFLLNANKKFIQEETIAYIAYNVANNIEPYVYYTYNAEKCRRDVSYVLEGYLSDLRHGGNRQTVSNASKYFENGVPQVDGDRTPEVAAHTFINSLIQNYILTNVAFTNKQVIVPQVLNNSVAAESGGITKLSTLATIVINVITNGLSSLPATVSNRGYIKIPGFYKLKDFLLVTNTTRNIILYNFADSSIAADLTYSGDYDSDFPAALYGVDTITTLTFDIDTSDMMVTDAIQIFVEGKEQVVKLNSIATDAMERAKVGIPQSMLDADFEYGLQPTKWQAIALMRNYPSVYEIPGTDTLVSTVVTDASAGTSGVGSSLITVTCVGAHSLSVNSPFTIKALANSVSGFSRAEGSFLVASVTDNYTFTYYAKSKVGTVNPTTLSTAYTQLRRAGFYTGAAVGTPAFNVYSSGSSGTITTVLTALSGIDVISFTGTAPPLGAPISGTGIVTGTQITAVTGTGGTMASTKLATKGLIGDTVITVLSTTGISPGLVFDRGDGTAVTVTDVNGNDVRLGGALTSVINGNAESYNALTQSATNGQGTGALINVSRNGATYNVSFADPGNGYVAGNTLTILGTALGGTSSNNATISVVSASPLKTVTTLNNLSLVPGSGYSDNTGVATTVSPSGGTGLTLDVTTDGLGGVASVAISAAGTGYSIGNTITISGGNGDATITVSAVDAGGVIQSATISGTPITAPTKDFISAFTINTPTSAQITGGNSGITYAAISTIEVVFASPHGFIPGNTLTVQITSAGTNAQLAAGAFYVEQVPSAYSIRYTARAAGAISNTLTGIVYTRPDSFFVHRPFDGGVQLGTGGSAHGVTAIRMSKKYIRYQSGKGVMYNTGALFAPSYDLRSLSATGTTVGSVVTVVTDDTDHGCQVGAQIVISGVTTSGYNGIYTVSDIIDERTFAFVSVNVLGATSAVIGTPCVMSVRQWHGSTVRSGIFDDQNGMFYQYDGMRIAVARRSSTFQVAGSIAIAANSNTITGTNTRFTQQLSAGDRVVIKGMSHVVSQILSDTSMYVTPDYRGISDISSAKIVKTIDITIPQENWNLDPCNGSGPSGYNLDITKMQMIGIQHTWYGAGFIDFMLRGPEGNYIFIHRFRNSNVNTEAYMRTGNQPVRYEVINEGAKGRLVSAMDSSQNTIPMSATDAYWFPNAGTVIIDAELISYTNNDGSNLTGCTRASSLTQFVGGAQRTFTGGLAASHTSLSGVILVSNTITPIISHWGSAFMIDGQFDSDRGYIFNYASTGISISVDKTTAFLVRLAPSVSNAQTGDLGEKELLNRAQMLLTSMSITSDSVSGGGALVVEGVLNPQNYPTDPNLITWTGLSSSAAGGQPSFAQIAPGGSVTWGGGASTQTATVQGAFTTTITGVSFAPVTQTLTATSFSAVTQTATATSFSAVVSSTYQAALSATRNDFLIPQATLTAFNAQTPVVAGDIVTVSGNNTALSSVAVSTTGGAFTCTGTAFTLYYGDAVTVSGTPTGSPIAGYVNPTTYYIVATNGSTSFTLSSGPGGPPITTAVVATTGLTFTVKTFFASGVAINTVTPNFITLNGTVYARIVMASNPTYSSGTASSNGQYNVNVTIASTVANTYNAALSASRTDFLIPQTQASLASVTDVLSVSTYLTAGQTISGITQNYTTITGTAYARVIMSTFASSTTTAGSGNNSSVTATSSATATYGSALSTARNDFLITDSQYTGSGILVGDGLSMATNLTGSQTIQTITQSYITIASVTYTRIIMSAVANATTVSGSGNNATITITAAGSAASYASKNYLFFTSSTWLSSGASIGTKVASDQTKFPAGTYVSQVTPRTFSASTVYRVAFTQSSNATFAASDTLKFQFGAAYATPGETVFSFINNPGNTDTLDLSALKEMTATAIGGRGAFPNGPDVLAINVYKVSGTATPANIVLRWSEAQA